MKTWAMSVMLAVGAITSAYADVAVGLRSIIFVEGSELRVKNSDVVARVASWLSEKQVEKVDRSKLGAVIPTFHVVMYGDESFKTYPVHIHHGEGKRQLGVVSVEDADELLLIFGAGRIWSLMDSRPRRTGDEVRKFDPGYRGK